MPEQPCRLGSKSVVHPASASKSRSWPGSPAPAAGSKEKSRYALPIPTETTIFPAPAASSPGSPAEHPERAHQELVTYALCVHIYAKRVFRQAGVSRNQKDRYLLKNHRLIPVKQNAVLDMPADRGG